MSIASSATVIDDSINGIKRNYSDLMAIFLFYFVFSISSNGMSNYTQNKELKKWESDPHMLCLSHATYSEKNWVKQSERQQTCTTSLREKNIFYTNFNFRSVLHAATITLHTILLSACASSSFLHIFFPLRRAIYIFCVLTNKNIQIYL